MSKISNVLKDIYVFLPVNHRKIKLNFIAKNVNIKENMKMVLIFAKSVNMFSMENVLINL